MIIQSQKVYLDEAFRSAQLVIEGQKIVKIQAYNQEKPDVDYGQQKILPGFIEMHVHGAYGHNCNQATHEGMRHWVKELVKEGVTSLYPTTSTAPAQDLLKSFSVMADVIEEKPEGCQIIGIHVEGPQISFTHKGAHNPYLIRKPDVEEFKQWQAQSRNNIRIITIAPEMDDNHDLIKYCSTHGVKVSIGHTGTTYEEAIQAIKDGAGSFTHTFNAMTGIHHRKPGVAGAALSCDDAYAELIGDGVHVHFAVAKILARAKGKDRLLMVTDAVQIKGLKPGIYDFPGRWVRIGEDGCGYLQDGTLAGSSNKLIDCIKKMITIVGVDETTVYNGASKNIAEFLGLETKGLLKENYDADITIIDDDYRVVQTYVLGKAQL